MKTKKILLEVRWGDAWGRAGWTDFNKALEDHSPVEVTQIGYLIKKDKKGITLASGYSEQNTPLAIGFIPRGMIRKTREIKY